MDSVQSATDTAQEGVNWFEKTWNDLTALFTSVDSPIEFIVAAIVVVIIVGGIIALIGSVLG